MKQFLNYKSIVIFITFLSFLSLSWAQPYGAADEYNLEIKKLPFEGIITLDEYDWFSTQSYLGVIQIDLATGKKRRLYQGKFPWRHQSKNVIYAQGCGEAAHRIMLVDSTGLPKQITPCSSEIENAGASPTDFEYSRLSPDQSKIAVESKAYLDWEYSYTTLVFDTETQALLTSFEGLIAPEWLPDGRLLMGSNEGIKITDKNLKNVTSLDDNRILGFVNNIDVDPSGTRLLFEFNQVIWHMNVDGSDLRELIYGSEILKFPTWSPDGKTVAYLATPQQDRFYPAMYFTNIETGESYLVDLTSSINDDGSTTVNGPLSWR